MGVSRNTIALEGYMHSAGMSRKHVYLLIGQRGAGKSFYAKRLLESQPGLSLASRDEILVKKFGSADTSPYDGTQQYAEMILHRWLRFKLSIQKEITIILDTWTGCSRERKFLLERLRAYGATRIAALYFITPLDLVNSWFWLKPGVAKIEEMKTRGGENIVFFSSDGPARDHELFHKLAREIDSDGFDEVIRVDPTKELIVLE